ncbi:MAG: cytidine/deoxycytidylate deaminase family protein [Deltaproteobacteria bacterium]|nr:cytidine/deoxycytidylate deaminase family protein [Deltaproteobacteria bacterium]
MSRPTIDEWALDILRATQARATCDRGRCAALILKDGRILAGGYVGSPRGMPHCDEAGHEFQETWVFSETLDDPAVKHRKLEDGGYFIQKKSCIRTIHAEQNAIAWAAREGISLMGGTLFCTLFPCQSCAKLIMQTGIMQVTAEYDYHSSQPSKDLFDAVGISYRIIRPGEAYTP